MELAEKYVYKIYQNKSFSKAAQKMYVTQAAMSATVKKLENKLGFAIFDRSFSPVALTNEGKIYIDYLKEIMETEENMKRRIQSLSEGVTESISAGGTCLLAYRLLPMVCGKFHKKFPEVEVKMDIGESSLYTSLFDKIDSGVLDIMIGYSCDKTKYSYVDLMEEKYVVALKRDFLKTDDLLPYVFSRSEILSGKINPEKIVSDSALFKDIPFHRVSKAGIVWRDMGDFLTNCKFAPCYVYNTRKNDIAYEMMLNGLSAVVTTDYVISLYPKSDDVLFFIVNEPKNTRQAMVIYKKEESIKPYVKEFIKILKETTKSKDLFN